ncbi:TrmH family RNA methyltransferase [Candidatus Similichlamydia laticola]|uniref:23S rRNA (Guanosine-2'-O-)-methyltransferase rlmB n=1 Tax=Candidatus Similichlamydia laticola TaxID=2170265 RepID=A0A369KBD4_9BACT|nr:RNA methyltransferase [Candidatus Similichlamydia laticola]RDB31228.1 23S rRNA (guanosine-2'-O-) -methyltransferase rlmB [Candidatus Similichlamydia laticola]
MEQLSNRRNSKIKTWKEQLKKKSSHFLLLPGEDLLEENRDSFIPKILLSTCHETLHVWAEKYALHHPELYLLTPQLLQTVCDLQHFQGICAIGRIRKLKMPCSGRFLFLDGIQDPGNFGAIVRSCLAFEWDGIFYTSDCCSPYQSKVIRASRGGILQIPLQKTCISAFLENTPTNQIWITKREGLPLKEIPLPPRPFVLVLGNEGHGPSSEWPDTCPGIWIPIREESLNVACAATLLLHALS